MSNDMKVVFINNPELEVIGDRSYRLSNPFYIIVNEVDGFIVPKGFETDLASVPRIPVAWLLAGGVANKSAILHDYFYRTGCVEKKYADTVFYYAMKSEGVSAWRRWMMYQAVNLFGGSSYKGTS